MRKINNLYYYYHKIYDDIVFKEKNKYIVKDYIWITFKFLEDKKMEPWNPRFYDFINKYKDSEPLLIEAIKKTLKEFEEAGKNFIN